MKRMSVWAPAILLIAAMLASVCRGDDVPKGEDDPGPGVIVVPLEGFIGTEIRREEVIAIGEKADEFGPGQIIALTIKTGGGSLKEALAIGSAIREMSDRHRTVAWIDEAVAAGCGLAMCCDEIYFKVEGMAGRVSPGHLPGEEDPFPELRAFHDQLVELALDAGRNPILAEALIRGSTCSYTLSEQTGERKWYADGSGEQVPVYPGSSLGITSSRAEHCGLSGGTADTPEELARLLDLPEWRELTDYGRTIAAKWQETCREAEHEIPRLIARFRWSDEASTVEVMLTQKIKILGELVDWIDRCPQACRYMGVPSKEELQRHITLLRGQLDGLIGREGGGEEHPPGPGEQSRGSGDGS